MKLLLLVYLSVLLELIPFDGSDGFIIPARKMGASFQGRHGAQVGDQFRASEVANSIGYSGKNHDNRFGGYGNNVCGPNGCGWIGNEGRPFCPNGRCNGNGQTQPGNCERGPYGCNGNRGNHKEFDGRYETYKKKNKGGVELGGSFDLSGRGDVYIAPRSGEGLRKKRQENNLYSYNTRGRLGLEAGMNMGLFMRASGELGGNAHRGRRATSSSAGMNLGFGISGLAGGHVAGKGNTHGNTVGCEGSSSGNAGMNLGMDITGQISGQMGCQGNAHGNFQGGAGTSTGNADIIRQAAGQVTDQSYAQDGAGANIGMGIGGQTGSQTEFGGCQTANGYPSDRCYEICGSRGCNGVGAGVSHGIVAAPGVNTDTTLGKGLSGETGSKVETGGCNIIRIIPPDECFPKCGPKDCRAGKNGPVPNFAGDAGITGQAGVNPGFQSCDDAYAGRSFWPKITVGGCVKGGASGEASGKVSGDSSGDKGKNDPGGGFEAKGSASGSIGGGIRGEIGIGRRGKRFDGDEGNPQRAVMMADDTLSMRSLRPKNKTQINFDNGLYREGISQFSSSLLETIMGKANALLKLGKT